jgi:hypothetical protein
MLLIGIIVIVFAIMVVLLRGCKTGYINNSQNHDINNRGMFF